MMVDTSSPPELSLELQLLKLWNKFLKRSDLNIDDDFFESGGDSLLATELLVEIEQLTQGTVPPSTLFETGTVRRLTERLARRDQLTPQPGIRIGGEEDRLFHFFHGDLTHGGLSVRTLAARLGPNRSIFAIAPHGIDGGAVPASIEEMAADRLPLVLKAQPRGPYVLGGHCNGALVAFETARLLVKTGRRVDLVVMIDPPIVSVRRSARLLLLALDLSNRAMGVAPDVHWQSLQRTWERLTKIEIRFRRYSGWLTHVWKMSWIERWDAVGRYLSKEARPRKPSEETWLGRELIKAYARRILGYYPSRLEVPVLYVALRFSGGGWRRITNDIELIDTPGHHFSLSGDSAAAIMTRVRARLDSVDFSSGLSAGG